jgi:hypothetical protein
MNNKLELIKRLLLQGDRYTDIVKEAETSQKTINKVIKEHSLQAFRKEVLRQFKIKNGTKLHTKAMQQKRTLGIRKLDRDLLGNQVKNQKRLDQKVLDLGYKNCSEYISQHGAMSFRNNILAN